MAKFNSSPVLVSYPAEKVFEKISNLESLKRLLENLPEDRIPADKREMFSKVEITPTSITLPGGPTGPVTLELVETIPPHMVRLEGRDAPVAMGMTLRLDPVDEGRCTAVTELDIEIPAMLKPMVAGPLQKMVDQFSMVLASMSF